MEQDASLLEPAESEPLAKRAKVASTPFDTVPDAADVPWSTRFADIYVIVPKDTGSVSEVGDFVRLPTHKLFLNIFPLLEMRLRNSENPMVDMTQAGWSVRVWKTVLDFAYDHRGKDLSGPHTTDSILAKWWRWYLIEELEEATLLLEYLLAVPLGVYANQAIHTPNMPCHYEDILTFWFMHSVTDPDALQSFRTCLLTEDSVQHLAKAISELMVWLLLRLGSQVARPRLEGVFARVCEWLFLLIATTPSEVESIWTSFWNGLRIWRDSLTGAPRGGWFELYSTLLVLAAPCPIHNAAVELMPLTLRYSDGAKAVELFEYFHCVGDSHRCIYTNGPSVREFWTAHCGVLEGFAFEMGWVEDRDPTSQRTLKWLRSSSHPILDVLQPVLRFQKATSAPMPGYNLACYAFQLVPK